MKYTYPLEEYVKQLAGCQESLKISFSSEGRKDIYYKVYTGKKI